TWDGYDQRLTNEGRLLRSHRIVSSPMNKDAGAVVGEDLRSRHFDVPPGDDVEQAALITQIRGQIDLMRDPLTVRQIEIAASNDPTFPLPKELHSAHLAGHGGHINIPGGLYGGGYALRNGHRRAEHSHLIPGDDRDRLLHCSGKEVEPEVLNAEEFD